MIQSQTQICIGLYDHWFSGGTKLKCQQIKDYKRIYPFYDEMILSFLADLKASYETNNNTPLDNRFLNTPDWKVIYMRKE